MIAGVQRTCIGYALGLWKRKPGTAKLGPYDLDRRGIQYALKYLENSADADIGFDLHPEHQKGNRK